MLEQETALNRFLTQMNTTFQAREDTRGQGSLHET